MDYKLVFFLFLCVNCRVFADEIKEPIIQAYESDDPEKEFDCEFYNLCARKKI
jgi:hypothetical protein